MTDLNVTFIINVDHPHKPRRAAWASLSARVVNEDTSKTRMVEILRSSPEVAEVLGGTRIFDFCELLDLTGASYTITFETEGDGARQIRADALRLFEAEGHPV